MPSIDLLIQKLKILEAQQRKKSESSRMPSGLSQHGSSTNLLGSSAQESPVKVGNINVYNMPKSIVRGLRGDVKLENCVEYCQGEAPADLDPNNERSGCSPNQALSRNQSAANILEQVIKRLQKLQSREGLE